MKMYLKPPLIPSREQIKKYNPTIKKNKS